MKKFVIGCYFSCIPSGICSAVFGPPASAATSSANAISSSKSVFCGSSAHANCGWALKAK